MNGVMKTLKNPSHLFFFLKRMGALEKLSDESYIKLMYKAYMGERLNIKNPISLNEKLQWMKLYYHDPNQTKMVDKYEAKKYVGSIIGEEHIIPTLGVWDSFDEIVFSDLPNKFVIKCTHDSGGLVICRDKKRFDDSRWGGGEKKQNRKIVID